jgi:hypothetical protein
VPWVIAERLPRAPDPRPAVHRRPPYLLRALHSLLRALEPWLRSLQPWCRALPSRLRALERWFRAWPARIRELPPVLESWFGGLRSLSLESVLRDAERLARRPSRLTLGVAAGTVLATGAVLAGVSAGSASPAAAVSDQDTARQGVPAEGAGHAAPTRAAGHAGPARAAASASAAPSGSASAAPSGSASAAPSGSGSAPASSQHLAAPAAPAAPATPYLIYDSVTPALIPASQGVVATYADGPHPVSASQVTGRRSVLWISITGQDYAAAVVDVEPGNATPAEAASWAWHRLSANPQAIARIYTMINEWPAVQAAVASFPAQMRARIHWWIANPTGSPHLVPGSDATQWYWGPNYDISTAAPGF